MSEGGVALDPPVAAQQLLDVVLQEVLVHLLQTPTFKVILEQAIPTLNSVSSQKSPF